MWGKWFCLEKKKPSLMNTIFEEMFLFKTQFPLPGWVYKKSLDFEANSISHTNSIVRVFE